LRFQVSGFSSVVGDTSVSTDCEAGDTVLVMDTNARAAAPIKSHRDLLVYQKTMDYIDFTYQLARKLPKEERFGVWSQLTRAAVSVATNITEGHARFTRKDFAYFLVLARSSLMETDTIWNICARQDYISQSDLKTAERRITEISKMLVSLRRSLLGEWKRANRAAA